MREAGGGMGGLLGGGGVAAGEAGRPPAWRRGPAVGGEGGGVRVVGVAYGVGVGFRGRVGR